MKKKISSLILALYLMAGCSSGGGVSGGAGTSTAGGLLLLAGLVADGTISIDVIRDLCTTVSSDSTTGEIITTVSGVEPAIPSKLGVFSVSISNISDLTGGLFPTGVILNSYTVTYIAQNDGGAPALTPRTFSQTLSILNGEASTIGTVVLADLGFTISEFRAFNPGGVRSYRVTVTYRGSTLSGESVTVSASTFLEFGNFDRCSG